MGLYRKGEAPILPRDRQSSLGHRRESGSGFEEAEQFALESCSHGSELVRREGLSSETYCKSLDWRLLALSPPFPLHDHSRSLCCCLCQSFVDVEDVAECHYGAATKPDSEVGKNRFQDPMVSRRADQIFRMC